MTKIVIAGKSDCPYFAKAELLADDLQTNLPNFTAHKISVHPEHWQTWAQETRGKHGWDSKHDGSSPIVWRELIDRGGKGLLLGGSNDFEEYVYQTYGLKLNLKTSEVVEAAKENGLYKATEMEEERQRIAHIQPLICCVSEGTSAVATCLYPHLVSGATFGHNQDVSVRVLDKEDNYTMGQGVVMELQDIASGLCRDCEFFSNECDAFKGADVILLLDDIFQDESIENEVARKHNHLARVKSHFEHLGAQICSNAKRTCKVLVAGRVPINYATSVLIETCTPTLLSHNIAGMANFKEKTAKALLGGKMGVNGASVHDVLLWGNVSGRYRVETKWAKVSHLEHSSITGPAWFCRPTSELIHDHKWLEGEFVSKLESRTGELKSSLRHPPWMKYACAVQETLARWFLGSNHSSSNNSGTFTHNLAVYLKNSVYGFEEGLVVSVPVKFYPGAFEVVEDLDISQSSKGSKSSHDESTESEAENSAEQQNIEWSQFVEKVCSELQEEKQLAIAMPVEKKVEREKTELDQTELGAPELMNDETLAEEGEPTVVIEKDRDETEVNLEGEETGRELQQPEEQQPQTVPEDPDQTEQPQDNNEGEPSQDNPQPEQTTE